MGRRANLFITWQIMPLLDIASRMGENFEIIVVGAGPGGASAAYFLAREGRRVLLLDKQSFPRDKSCGDGITRAGARLLAEMGVLGRFEKAQRVHGARVYLRGKGSRDFNYPVGLVKPDHGLVVPRMELDNVLCQQAVYAGAVLRENCTATRLLYTDSAVTGVEILHRGDRQQLNARVVIAADGAASRLARQAGLVTTPAEEMGFAIRGYYGGLRNLSGLLEIYLPLMDPSDHYLLPSYGWVFPTGPHSANIGVGLFQRVAGVNVRQLMAQFLEFLQNTDRRFAEIQALGNWLGAPLRFDFQPNRCTKPGLALVGDAAGMISPFTGEGISYAIESGKLAAQVIHASLSDISKSSDRGAGVDLSEYGRQLGRHYIGYFEAGRQSARRYLLMWRVLESTFRNEKPLYAMCRQAALFPEGLGESYANALMEDVSGLVGDASPTLASDLLATNEALADTVRHDWPFLVRAVRADLDLTGIPFRPALLVCLAAYLGNPQRSALHLAGAAIEQGYLAAIAQLSVEEETPQNGTPHSDRKANWGNMFALMVGDFLMSKAFELSAQIGAIVSHEIAAALAIASEGQVRELREAYNHKLAVHQHVDILGHKIATLFELPCRLGARLGMLPPAQVAALAKYGRHFGLAYQILEDCRSFTPQVNGQTWPILADPRQGIYSLPVLYALQSEYGQEIQEVLRRVREENEALVELTTYVRQSGALEQTKVVAFANAEQAQAALDVLPDNASRQSLYQLAAFTVERAKRGIQLL
jgi:menaquinone-9 beta-reductase